MVKWFRENAIPVKQTEGLSEEDLVGKIIVGEFIQRQRLTLEETLYGVIEEAKKEIGKNRN
jgi:2-oxoglutarate ferredoxin oxidoreductase subunit beta